MSNIEERLSELEDRIARLDQEQQRAWGVVLAFLREQRRAVGQERASLDRAIDGLEGKTDK